MTTTLSAPFGLILAGGDARRLGGGDKPLRPLRGRAMLTWLIERLGSQCDGLAINARGDPARWRSYGLPVIGDRSAAALGPLAGVLAGLDHLADAGHDGNLLTVSGDTPFVPHDLVMRLEQARCGDRQAIACAASAGRTHPVVALWPLAVRAPLEHALMDQGLRGVAAFQATMRTVVATWAAAPFDPFFNVNTPEDYQAAETIAAAIACGS